MTAPDPITAALRELVAVKDLKDRTEALHFAGPNGPLGDAWEAEYNAGRSEYTRRQPLAWEAARAALASAAAPAQGVPEGWKLVPVEPTEFMEGAGAGAVSESFMHGKNVAKMAVEAYRAMLAATPPSPAQAAGWRDIESAPRDGKRPLRRGGNGVCARTSCECEREGLGDQCIWLRPAPGQQTGGQSTNQPG